MATFTNSILIKNKDQVVPRILVEKLIKHNPTVASAAWVVNNELNVFKWVGKNKPTVDQIVEGMDKFKNLSVVFSFGNYPDGFSLDDVPPFTILSSNNKPALVAFLDGEFIDCAEEKSKHSNAFFAAQTLIIPTVEQLSQLCGGNLDKILGALQTPIQTKNFLAKNQRGVVCFLARTGEIIPLQLANKDSFKSDWGWCSNVYDYKENAFPQATAAEASEEPEEVEEEIQALPWETQTPVTTEVPEEVEDVEEVEEVEKVDPPKQFITTRTADGEKEEETYDKFELDAKKSMVRCPAEIQSANGQKKWYRRNFDGWLPTGANGYETRPWVASERLGKHSPVLKKLITLGAEKMSVRLPTIKSFSDIPKDILSAPASSPAEKATGQKRETKDQPLAVPIISAEAKKDINKNFLTKEFRDKSGERISDPKLAQEQEKRYGTFCSQLGLKGLEETFGWLYEDWQNLATIDANAVCVAILQYRNALVSALSEQEEVEENVLVEAFTRKAG